MSQRAFLAELDTQLHVGFIGAGMADAGAYTPPPPADPIVVDCRVYVDRDVQTLGDTRQFKAGRVEVVYILGSMAVSPAAKGRVVVDGDTYANGEEISNDGSLSRWVVRRG